MKRKPSFWLTPHRAVSTVLIWTMMAPAYAVSPGYTGFVTQSPMVYTRPPDVNVMFTLDDSGSMQSDAIPDFSLSGASYTGVPNNANSAHLQSARGIWYPNMWGPGSSYFTIDYYRNINAAQPNRSAVARYMRSSAGNPLYYNPAVTYSPWVQNANNTLRMVNATPSAVRINYSDASPLSGAATTINLTVRQGAAGNDESTGFWPATYYVYTGTTPMPLATPNTALNVSANFVKYEIQGTGTATFRRAATRTDCSGAVGPTGCSRTEEMQNFANWLQYFRNRRLMTKGGVSEAFARQGTNLRAGFSRINASPTVRRGVRQFSDSDLTTGAATNARTAFFDLLYSDPSGNSITPLRSAMDDVGRHFQTAEPWAENPGSSGGTEYSCRRSFHIMSTDGYWNDAAAQSPANTNRDNFATGWTPATTPAKPDGTTYAFGDNITATSDPLVGRFTVNPFRDGTANTLSDVAAHYWRTDLRTTIGNNVVPSTRDPAFWQHLSTFTIGLGISGSGTVRPTDINSLVVPNVINGVTLTAAHPLYPYIGRPWLADQRTRDWLVENKIAMNWSVPDSDNPATGDDLIHASMVGRGRYFQANNPTELADGLAAALNEVVDQPLDQAAVAADSPQVRAGNHVVQATFSPVQWSGRLYSFRQNASTGVVDNRPSTSGNLNASQVWEASLVMPAPTARSIFTSTGAAGSAVPFVWGSLSAAQRLALNSDSTLVDYLRGSAARERANSGPFRDRARYTLTTPSGTLTGGVLGDIVNSSPIKGPDFGGGYDQLPSADASRSTYAAFRLSASLNNMRNSLFLGANDGMLHAFNFDTGVERFAYVPSSIYTVPRSTVTQTSENKLAMLSDPLYNQNHRFTVDGPPNISDAYVGGAWKTILTSALGAGARSIFAIDVTNPDTSSGFGASNFMWEFGESNSVDMGFVLGYPHIVRMRNGQWAVLFGNGYDSRNGVAKLFVLSLADGSIIREFAVNTGAAGNNGLAQPNFVVNENREVTAVYAGDLKGNLWKFDMDSTNPAAWNVAFSNTPLFTAIGPSNARQPITVMPEITGHPQGGALVSFGTGKYFELTDLLSNSTNVNLGIQSLYGIWDRPLQTTGVTVTSANRATVLRRQTASVVTEPVSLAVTSANVPDWTTQRGWYIDLEPGGERSNLPPQQVRGVLIAVANLPLPDPCANGGRSRIFFLDPLTGGNPSFPTVDADRNGVVNDADLGVNILVNYRGLLTQPIFQLSSTSTSTVPQFDVATIPYFNRGQATGGRAGGVELRKSFGDLSNTVFAPEPPPPGAPCTSGAVPGASADQMVLTAAMSNTELLSVTVSTGRGTAASTPCRPRISWRQLK